MSQGKLTENQYYFKTVELRCHHLGILGFWDKIFMKKSSQNVDGTIEWHLNKCEKIKRNKKENRNYEDEFTWLMKSEKWKTLYSISFTLHVLS